MADTINNDIPYVPENVIDPAAGLNISLNVIDALLQIVVESIGDTAPPVGVEGQRHIVGVGATGDWAGEDNKMARWLNGRWEFYSVNFVVYSGGIYTFNGTTWDPASGTVTSVDASAPTGLTVSGNPITGAGTLVFSYESGYSIPTNAKQLEWDDAYGWGNHALAGYQAQLVSGVNIKTINGQSILGAGDLPVSGGGSLNDLSDVVITSATSGEALIYDGANWVNQALAGSGTVTSVAMTTPTGLEVTGSPITSSGTLAVTFAAGYSLVAGADRTLWDAAIQPTGSTIQDVTLDEYDETINATAGATLDRSTGGIQKLAMTAAVNLDVSTLGAGQSVTYRITGADTHALTFTGLTDWSTGTAPTWKAIHYVEIVNFDGEIVAFDAGGR